MLMVWEALEAPEATEAVPAMALQYCSVNFIFVQVYGSTAYTQHKTQVMKNSTSRYQGSLNTDGVEGLGGYRDGASYLVLQVQFLAGRWWHCLYADGASHLNFFLEADLRDNGRHWRPWRPQRQCWPWHCSISASILFSCRYIIALLIHTTQVIKNSTSKYQHQIK